jgi:hypothetical protein
VVLRLVPTPLTTVMITTEIPAAIRPYSMAVAPVSSARNLRMVFMLANVDLKAKELLNLDQ